MNRPGGATLVLVNLIRREEASQARPLFLLKLLENLREALGVERLAFLRHHGIAAICLKLGTQLDQLL